MDRCGIRWWRHRSRQMRRPLPRQLSSSGSWTSGRRRRCELSGTFLRRYFPLGRSTVRCSSKHKTGLVSSLQIGTWRRIVIQDVRRHFGMVGQWPPKLQFKRWRYAHSENTLNTFVKWNFNFFFLRVFHQSKFFRKLLVLWGNNFSERHLTENGRLFFF